MTRRTVWAVAVAVLVVGLLGCGGGGSYDTPEDTPSTPQRLGTLVASVTGSGNLSSSRVLLDGAEVPVRVGSNGELVIPGLPPGDHVVDVIGPDGMHAGRATFEVKAGEETEVDPIPLEPSGQIVGIITQRDGASLTPLAGVQVVAQANVDWANAIPVPGTEASARTAEPITIDPTDPTGDTFTATTDTDGSYAIKGVQAGLYLVTVAVPGLEAGEQLVWVDAGHTAVADFELEAYIEPGVGTLECTVYAVAEDGSKTPLEGAIVEAYPEDGWLLPGPGDPIELPPGVPFPADLVARASLSPDDGTSDDGSFDGGDGCVDCVLPPDVIWRSFSTITDANGKCSLNVPAGHCDVSAWAYGYEYAGERVTVTDGSTVSLTFELRAYDFPEEPPLPPLEID